jgi:hypothetical protein
MPYLYYLAMSIPSSRRFFITSILTADYALNTSIKKRDLGQRIAAYRSQLDLSWKRVGGRMTLMWINSTAQVIGVRLRNVEEWGKIIRIGNLLDCRKGVTPKNNRVDAHRPGWLRVQWSPGLLLKSVSWADDLVV